MAAEGYYTFKWDGKADECYVTGEFDNWSKSIKLEKDPGGESLSKTVLLQKPAAKTFYKFVVDGHWTTHPNAPTESEDSGVINNVLYPDDIVPSAEMSAHPFIQSAGPQSTTAQLAAKVPKETGYKSADPADAADAAPAAAPAVGTPGGSDVPGGFPSSIPPTPAAATEDKGKSPLDEAASQQTFSVNPLPASNTPTNPIDLKPGESIPKNDYSAKDVNAYASVDKADYDAPDSSNLGMDAAVAAAADTPPVLPEVVTPAEKRAADGHGILDLPPISAGMIPESSLAMTGNASTAPETSAPSEPIVPAVVKDSQAEAGAPAEASASSTAVDKKAAMEEELKSEVPTAPADAEGNTVTDAAKGYAQVATTYAHDAANYASGTIASVAAAAGLTSASGPSSLPPANEVPEIVKESQEEAGAPAEASSNPTAVERKTEFENELKSEIPAAPPAAGGTIADNAKAALEGAGATVAATAVAAQEYAKAADPPTPAPEAAINAVNTKLQDAPVVVNGVSSAPIESTSVPEPVRTPVGAADNVPEPVKESQAEAGVAPEAAGSASAVANKEAMEAQLTSEIPAKSPEDNDKPTPQEAAETLAPVEPAPAGSSSQAPTASAFTESGAPAATTGNEGATESAPVATTASATPSEKEAGAAKADAGSQKSTDAAGTAKSSKRKSFFGKIKEKLHFGARE